MKQYIFEATASRIENTNGVATKTAVPLLIPSAIGFQSYLQIKKTFGQFYMSFKAWYLQKIICLKRLNSAQQNCS